jgi:hypothetical protein
MKIKIGQNEIEGTKEEIAQLLKSLIPVIIDNLMHPKGPKT